MGAPLHKKLSRRLALQHGLAGITALGSLLALPSVGRASASDDEVTRLKRMITKMARERDVPVTLALAVAEVESGYQVNAEGPTGARGLFQILPHVAEQTYDLDPDRLWRPRVNARIGLRMLSDLLKEHDGKWRPALMSYASGPQDTVVPGLRIDGSAESYVAQVFAAERDLAEVMGRDGEPRRDQIVERAHQSRSDDGAWQYEQRDGEWLDPTADTYADLPGERRGEDVVADGLRFEDRYTTSRPRLTDRYLDDFARPRTRVYRPRRAKAQRLDRRDFFQGRF